MRTGLSCGGRVAGFAILATMVGSGCSGGSSTTPPSPPDHLSFVVQPSAVPGSQPMFPGVQVALLDASGKVATAATNPVSIALAANPGAGSLGGTTIVNALAGIATFTSLQIDHLSDGYSLKATSGTLAAATSAPFPVVRAFATISVNGSTSLPDGFVCGVALTGAAYCWGFNSHGELGIDSSTGPEACGPLFCSSKPVPVAGGLTFAKVAAGGNFACALTATGVAYCWGKNDGGQLGNGTTTDSLVPTPVGGGLTFTSLSAGPGFACALTGAGAAYCWGVNDDAQLGIGDSTGPGTCNSFQCSSLPIAVSGGLTFAGISVGRGYACGWTGAGAAYCWGHDQELGHDTTSYSPVPLAVNGGHTFASLSAGTIHACGVTTTGVGYCWGFNTDGELGDGTVTLRSSPVPIFGTLVFTTLSAGTGFTCGIASSPHLTACWGYNGYGGLGNGTASSSLVPVSVVGGLDFATVSAGAWSTCGITVNHVAYCWGENSWGESGNGTRTAGTRAPVAVLP